MAGGGVVHDSHGVGMIPSYVRHLQAGLVSLHFVNVTDHRGLR